MIKRLSKYNIKPDDITSEDQLLRVLSSVKQAEDNVFNNKFKGIMGNNIFNKGSNQKPAEVFDLKGKKIKNTDNIIGGEELPGETNIFSNKYLNDLDKKIIDSDAFGYSQKEWNNLSNSSKEKFRRQFDSNYEDAMENTKMATLKAVETDEQIKKRLNKGNQEGIERLKNKPLDPDDVLPNYNETPGEYSRRKTPGSKENLLQELKIAYEKEFNRLRGDETVEELKEILKNLDTDGVPFAAGGRAGLYQGGQAQIEPDLSGIGHGSDALMARNMLIAPGSQATTSTGLNYLLGEDNDTTRVPYKDAGPVVLPKPKPAADPMVELQRIYDLYKKSMLGVSQETQKYLQQDFIQKLNEANISQEQFMSSQMQNNFAQGGPARQNFGMGKRAFLKLIGSGVAGIAGIKTGLF